MIPDTLGFRDMDTLRKVFAGTYRKYAYSTPVTSVAASSSVQAVTSIDSMTDFVCTSILGRVLYDSGGKINREVDFFANLQPRFEVIDSGSMASQYDRSDVLFSSNFGTAEDPYELDQPHVFIARTVITTIMVNVDTTIGYRCQVAFHGFKVPAGRM